MPRSVDLHRNLFYSYRGPDTGISDRDRQLENNVTRALVNTLELGGAVVCGPFLAEFLCLSDASDPKFLLQRHDLPLGTATTKRDRMLLGISKRELDWADTGTNGTYESVPDAWVYGDGFAVLIESKVDDTAFSQEQMQAHLTRLQSIGRAPPRIVRKTWGQIHGFFENLLPRLTDAPSAKLLVEQFIQFLEYSGMSEFTGFRLDHFNYFLLHDDEDARIWVREQVEYFATRVQARLYELEPFYEACDIGTLKRTDAYCWVAFGPGGGAYRRKTHQTMSLGANGLQVFVNTELKTATDRLKSVLKQSGSAFRAALQNLHAFNPFELVLEERTQRQASLYDYTPKMKLHSSMLGETTGDVAWTAFAQTVDRLPLPYLRIERLVPAKKLLELSKGDPLPVVQYVVEILRRNHAIVSLLNE